MKWVHSAIGEEIRKSSGGTKEDSWYFGPSITRQNKLSGPNAGDRVIRLL